MTFCAYMDPLNWAHRMYLIEAIDECGFENGWEPIIQKIQLLCSTFMPEQGSTFNLSPDNCNLWYLQVLAEFGDFRRLSDPLTPPSQEIKDKIKAMRRSQLRHELLLVNNQLRYNNYILKHHHDNPIIAQDLQWVRFNTEPKAQPQIINNLLVETCIKVNESEWFKVLPTQGLQGKKLLSMNDVLARCISGAVTDALEFVRDIIQIHTNYSICTLSDREKNANNHLRTYCIDAVRPLLEKDPRWQRIKEFVDVPL
ncbi:hypothetical protein TVAG_346180 [Trichomonas vaginalis G3]|uniref:Uncharacterized protein n=1 Tax=Trichomonas vaginalis (strain ATCC PRA-98 / G3) TaxID=412133 RepID=A2FK08_TRIV3|nr:hypothetical protein TVAGG3_1018850 [Trichomonas vaginalis G3]EAX94755.1 hypothetical protein TVAG_346180 [Trichomonas vaginalis G3]KAI5491999.1 hypothetical protein TVAGG3_1018850 [Trichomonas vaginalis G3]|eukprot:XP_001307685.1 hypothetical protein [Trichomonas vaginalis G3]